MLQHAGMARRDLDRPHHQRDSLARRRNSCGIIQRFWLFHPDSRGHGCTGSDPGRSRESPMSSDNKSCRVEVKDGDQPVAAAEAAKHAEGTVRTSLLPTAGHTPPGSRASLVDAVMETPEVRVR